MSTIHLAEYVNNNFYFAKIQSQVAPFSYFVKITQVQVEDSSSSSTKKKQENKTQGSTTKNNH